MSASPRKIVLAKSADWRTWFSFIQIKAESLEIWDEVNPNEPFKESLKRPEIPNFPISENDDDEVEAGKYQMLQLKTQLYRLKLDEYKVRKAALTELKSKILESLSTEYGVYLEDINHKRGHPWKILTALEQRIAPFDAAQIRDIETKYQKLKKGPGNQIWRHISSSGRGHTLMPSIM